jgi:hypothetical protein
VAGGDGLVASEVGEEAVAGIEAEISFPVVGVGAMALEAVVGQELANLVGRAVGGGGEGGGGGEEEGDQELMERHEATGF